METKVLEVFKLDELTKEAKAKAYNEIRNSDRFISYQNDVLQQDYDNFLLSENSYVRIWLEENYGVESFELGEGRGHDVWLKDMKIDPLVFLRKSERECKLARFLEEHESLGQLMCSFLRDNRFAWHGYVNNSEQYDIDAAKAFYKYVGIDEEFKYTKQVERICKKMHKAPLEIEEKINEVINGFHESIEKDWFLEDYCDNYEIQFLSDGTIFKH